VCTRQGLSRQSRLTILSFLEAIDTTCTSSVLNLQGLIAWWQNVSYDYNKPWLGDSMHLTRQMKNGLQKSLESRLHLEVLEDRSLPSATTVGTLTGFTFIDHFNNGIYSSGEATLPGLSVTLSGQSNSGQAVNTTVTTDSNGFYTFNNVLPGTYQLTTPTVTGLLGTNPTTTVVVPSGQSVAQNLGFEGIDPSIISERLFLASTQAKDFPAGSNPAGSGVGSVSGPFVAMAIADINAAVNSTGPTIDLAGTFGDVDYTTSQITFNTNIGPLNVTLFDAQAPQTVANFYDYIDSGAYDNAIFSRLISDFVLQGGGATVQFDPTTDDVTGLTAIPTLPTVPNEFTGANSNVFGTIAMAQSGGNPNSATDQFFFNLGNNSSSLDPQAFVVFGAVTGASDQQFLTNLNNLAASNPQQYSQNQSNTAVAATLPTVDLKNIPLPGYTGTNFPTDAKLNNFIVINSVTVDSRPEVLSYQVIANTNPALVNTVLTNEQLTLNYAPNMTGTATITVQATNQNGATATNTFSVTIQ
jgi:cyclophilin family peptidyl-prolyl cis-trans isomerase